MGKSFDAIDGIKNAWGKFTDAQLMKWTLASVAVGALAQIPSLVGPKGTSVVATGAEFGFLMVWFPIYLLALLGVFFYVTPRFIGRALELNSIEVGKMPGAIEWLMLHIRLFVVDVLMWYDKRVWVPVLALVALAIISLFVMPTVAIVFGVLAILVYAIGVIVHRIRTYFATYKLIRGDGAEGAMPKQSFDVVKGQTVEVFVPQFLFGVLTLIVMMVPVFFVSAFVGAQSWIVVLVTLLIQIPIIAISMLFSMNLFKFFFGGSAGAFAPKTTAEKKSASSSPSKKAHSEKGAKRGKK